MITVQEAKKLILEKQTCGKVDRVSIDDACGSVLAENVVSPIDLPVFDASAMDGFAIRSCDTDRASKDHPVRLQVGEEIWAGKVPEQAVSEKGCSRIMTGAMVPRGADAVVMQENVVLEGQDIVLTKPNKPQTHIRFSGEEIKKREMILAKGTVLNAASIGLLASVGVKTCSVFAKPKVVIIPTGTELVRPGQRLKKGQIFESNSFALKAALAELGVVVEVMNPVKDDHQVLNKAVMHSLNFASHVILCGGVSVGDYDYNKAVLADNQVKEVFWKVAQKPGKPLYFGIKNQTVVFGVPGNPASSLVCYYEYIRPALLKYKGYSPDQVDLPIKRAKLVESFKKKPGRTHFVRGCFTPDEDRGSVKILGKQGSHMMSSFAQANCLIEIPAEVEALAVGSDVEVHLLP